MAHSYQRIARAPSRRERPDRQRWPASSMLLPSLVFQDLPRTGDVLKPAAGPARPPVTRGRRYAIAAARRTVADGSAKQTASSRPWNTGNASGSVQRVSDSPAGAVRSADARSPLPRGDGGVGDGGLSGLVRTVIRSPGRPKMLRISAGSSPVLPNQCGTVVSNVATSPGARTQSWSPRM